jgi:hypothetical protein
MFDTLLNGNVFSRITSYIGFVGSSLLVNFVVLMTFIPAVEKLASAIALPEEFWL